MGIEGEIKPVDEGEKLEQKKRSFIEKVGDQGSAVLNTLKLGVAAGFLSEEEVAKIRASFEKAGWVGDKTEQQK